LKNEADSAIHNTERSLSEHKAKLQQADVQEIETEITNLRTLLADGKAEPQVLRDGIEKVKNAAMKIGKAMYAQQQSSGGSTDQGQQQGQQGTGGEQGGQQQQGGEGEKKDGEKKDGEKKQ